MAIFTQQILEKIGSQIRAKVRTSCHVVFYPHNEGKIFHESHGNIYLDSLLCKQH